MAYEKTDRSAQRTARLLRWSVLGTVLVAVTALANLHQRVNGSAKPVGIDALCPFGGLETLWSMLAGAGYIEKIAASSIALLVGAAIMALVYRRSFCGQVCPLGALQGVFGALGRRLFGGRRHLMPAVLDRPARWIKYVILVGFTVWTWQAAALVMRPYDPWAAWAHITSDELLAEFAVGVGILALALVGSVVYERFFCKYLCPMGALLGSASKVSALHIERNDETCISCLACDHACPMNVEVSTADSVTSSECISCNECVNSCPVAGALEIKTAKRNVVSARAATGIVVGILAIVILGATAIDAFEWTMPSLKEAIERESGLGEKTEQAPFDTTVIKGYMSMSEIADATGIPEAEFTKQWGVPAKDLGSPMKEIKDQYGFSPDDVKVWVGEQLSR